MRVFNYSALVVGVIVFGLPAFSFAFDNSTQWVSGNFIADNQGNTPNITVTTGVPGTLTISFYNGSVFVPICSFGGTLDPNVQYNVANGSCLPNSSAQFADQATIEVGDGAGHFGFFSWVREAGSGYWAGIAGLDYNAAQLNSQLASSTIFRLTASTSIFNTTLTASSTCSGIGSDSFGFGHAICEGFAFLFIPNPNTLSQFSNLASTTEGTFPINWFMAFRNAAAGVGTPAASSSPTLSFSFSAVDCTTAGAVCADIHNWIPDFTYFSTTSLALYIGESTHNTFLNAMALALYLGFGYYVYRRVQGLAHAAAHS